MEAPSGSVARLGRVSQWLHRRGQRRRKERWKNPTHNTSTRLPSWCRECWEPISWERTAGGHTIAIDREPVEDGILRFRFDRRIILWQEGDDGYRYAPHICKERRTVDDLQALVTGMLIGALMQQQQVDLTVQPLYDERQNYLPKFVVVGGKSGKRLRVSVEVEE